MTQDVVSQITLIRGRSAQAETDLLRDFIAATVAREIREALRGLPMATLAGQSQLLTVKQAAHILNIKERTLYALVDKKRIPFRRVGGALRFDCAELEAWTKGVTASQTSILDESQSKRTDKLRVV